MIKTLSYAPICNFFERIPLGRILNRFTKDMNVMDSDLLWAFSGIYI